MKGKGQRSKSCRSNDVVKVTYISSPMKVKTSASNFRALVQELTGQDSNVAETFVEGPPRLHHHDQINENDNNYESVVDCDDDDDDSNWLKRADYYSGLFQYSASLLDPLSQHLPFDDLVQI